MKIAFLDRDGVLNREMGSHVWQPERFEILPDVIPALKLLTDKGFELVVITNQSGIGLGLYGHEEVEVLHTIMKDKFLAAGICLLAIFYCPHHPTNSNCLCRKPKGLLVEKALSKYGAKAEECIMFGDRERDLECANMNGVRGVLLDSNSSLLTAVEQALI